MDQHKTLETAAVIKPQKFKKKEQPQKDFDWYIYMMEWYTNFNYSSIGNDSANNGNVGAWPYSTSTYNFGYAAMFGIGSSELLSALFAEIFKSSLITLIGIAGLARIKSNDFKSYAIHLIETWIILTVAVSFYALLAVFLIPFLLYRLLVQLYFLTYKSSCKLMHGTDAFWCMDGQEAKSIINIMILLDINDKGVDLLESLSELMVKLCSDPVYGFKFSSYRKKSRSGYFYWEKGNVDNVKSNISYIGNRITNEKDLNTFLSGILNKSINGFGWEVYISQTDLDESHLRPVIFRMHHSIGDGSSILSVLMNTISDKSQTRFTLSQTINISFQPHGTNFKFSVPNSVPFEVRKSQIINSIKSNLYKIPAFIYGPLSLIRQLFFEDKNFQLSVKKLTGKKVIAWFNNEEMLSNIKQIRRKYNSSFSDVVFGLFSNSIERYLERRGSAPKEISVVVPIFGTQQKDLKVTSEIIREGNNIKVSRLGEINSGMENGFWVAMLRLPLNVSYSKSLKTKINYIKESTEALRKSPDYIMYKFILSVIVTLVPGELVKPLFDVAKTHLVFSNLPGPQNEIKIAGNALKEMTFWLPNRGTTGLGLSLLSNNKKLSIALIADTAVIPTQHELQSILDDFIYSAYKESS